jgi:ribosomal protein S7
MAEPLSREVLQRQRAALGSLRSFGPILAGQPAPPVRLDNRRVFEESIAGLCTWLKSTTNPDPGTFASSPGQFLAACVEVRRLAEEGETEAALTQLSALYPASSETRKQALAPVFGELAWSLLQAIEQQLERGNHEKANVLAKNAMAIIERTPFRDEFKSLSQTLFASRPAAELTTVLEPSTAAPAPDSERARIRQAEALLCDYADELSMADNHLEREFLQAVRDGSETAFKRHEKLKNRVQRSTRWGGREPYRTILKLLEAGGRRSA